MAAFESRDFSVMWWGPAGVMAVAVVYFVVFMERAQRRLRPPDRPRQDVEAAGDDARDEVRDPVTQVPPETSPVSVSVSPQLPGPELLEVRPLAPRPRLQGQRRQG